MATSVSRPINAAPVDSGSRTSPNLIVGSIPLPSASYSRIFMQGSAGPVTDPTLANGAAGQRLKLFCTDNTKSVTLTTNGNANMEVKGTWLGRNGSVLELSWDNVSKWVEDGRNEA